MSRKNRSRQSNSPAAATAADANPVTVDTTVTATPETEIDPIDAALAAIEAEDRERAEIIALADVEEVEIDTDGAPSNHDAEVEAIIEAAADADEAELVGADDETTVEAAVENLIDAAEALVAAADAVTEDEVQDVIQNEADALLAELEADDAAAAAPAAATGTKTPRTKKATTPATPPATARDFHTIAAIDDATLKSNLKACNAVKVVEKAQNLIQAVTVGKKLSRYTSIAIKRLVADGKITGKGLVETFESAGLSTGTARAQAQQMTALFKITGVAQPDASAPKELLVADAALANELMRLAA